MVEAPAREKLPLGSGAPSGPTGETRSRSLSLGVLVMGLVVSVWLPFSAGGGVLLPVGDGPEPVLSTTWLLMTSIGRSRIDVSLPRRSFGQRTETSKIFSPSIML